MRIVIVDDDMLVSSALKTILEVNADVQVEGMGSDVKEAIALY